MTTPALQTPDFWRVNSYSYPNCFSSEENAQRSWRTFLSFYQHRDSSYRELKEYWDSADAPRELSGHAAESWKATFEELGLLYVITRSDHITITPAGLQLYNAAINKDPREFIWIGLNLLFRYPLKGPPSPRRPKSEAHDNSDLLIYRFLYSAMRDLGDFFWWTELERIFCRVFLSSEAPSAIEAVNEIRSTPSRHKSYVIPAQKRKGVFYNSLNQVANHAGMNHLILLQENDSEHYGALEPRRRHSIDRQFLELVSAALGDRPGTFCRDTARYVDRLPTAPQYTDEKDYFKYLGAEVPPLQMTSTVALPISVSLGGDNVFILKFGEHFQDDGREANMRFIQGTPRNLCSLARNQRVILTTDTQWTYILSDKTITGPDSVRLALRRARPITNFDPIQQYLGEENE